MNDITGFTFYRSYHECLCDLDDKNRKEMLVSIVDYVFFDIEPELKGIKKTLWTVIKPNLDTSKHRSNNAKKENQNKIKMKSKQNQNEINDLKNISLSLSNSLSNIKYNKYGIYKRILLSIEEYNKLVEEYNKEFIDNQINKLDEYVESNNNKNKYSNWNLVLRKSIREKWFDIKTPSCFNTNIKKEEMTKEELAELEESFKEFR